MQNNYLLQRNFILRQNRPTIKEDEACEIFQTDTLLEVSLSRGRCANDAKGTCIMCNYGATGKNRTISSYLQDMKQALDNCSSETTCLMLCTNGSIFDENQIEKELLEGAIDLAAQCNIPRIEFESHYQDITMEKLSMLQSKLKEKEVIIALGLETINQTYQDYIIAKGIRLQAFQDKIALVQQTGFQLELNVMLGLPFLSTKEQFEDTCETIKWIFSHKCRPVLFPINIKPHTLLMEMYRTGYYTPISHWLLLLVLNTFTAEELSQIILVWYGNRIENYGDERLKQILPTCCDKCEHLLNTFYSDFADTESGNTRKQLLYNTLHTNTCTCLKKVQKELQQNDGLNFLFRYKTYENYLRNMEGR